MTCDHKGQDEWFDRSVCPPPCGAMHFVCSNCGGNTDSCAHDNEPAQGTTRPHWFVCAHDNSGRPCLLPEDHDVHTKSWDDNYHLPNTLVRVPNDSHPFVEPTRPSQRPSCWPRSSRQTGGPLPHKVFVDEAFAELDRLRDGILAIHRAAAGGGYCVGCWEGGGEDGAVSWPCATALLLAQPDSDERRTESPSSDYCRECPDTESCRVSATCFRPPPQSPAAASNTREPICDRVGSGTNRGPGGEPSSEAAAGSLAPDSDPTKEAADE